MKLKGFLVFKVIGSGKARNGKWDIPKDMLRYDTAFINPDDPTLVYFPQFVTKFGTSGGRVTKDRWKSFGISLQLVTDQCPPLSADLITFHHPPLNGGFRDYSKLEPLKLARFLEVDHYNKL